MSLRPVELDAVIFDLDGVLTDTARLHFRAWKTSFDALLRERAGDDRSYRPFTRADYRRHVDGRPRYEGARDFLRSRGVELPIGDPGDPPGRASVCGVANRKNELYGGLLRGGGPGPFDDAVDFLRRLESAGLRTAVVSSSRNGRAVLEAAGLEGRFDAVVDGSDLAERDDLAGKPAPDLFLEAARRLDVEPGRAAVVEDAVPGVEAGRRGGFGAVIGVARDGERAPLEEAGAHAAVGALDAISISPGPGGADAPEPGPAG